MNKIQEEIKIIFNLKNYFLIGDYVFPAINDAWTSEQGHLISDIKSQQQGLEIAVDGQCDSPGFSASYCTVTAMDAATNKVVDLNVVHVGEVKSSQGKYVKFSFDFFFLFV